MIKRIEPDKCIARGVVRDGLIYFTGHAAAGAKEGKMPTMREQARVICERFEGLLDKHGSHKNNIIFAEVFITDMSLKTEFDKVWSNWLSDGHSPARVCIGTELQTGLLLEVTMIAELIS